MVDEQDPLGVIFPEVPDDCIPVPFSGPFRDPGKPVFSSACGADVVHDFYDRALCAALGGLLGNPLLFNFKQEPAEVAAISARVLTERRFGVKLVLPGDGE